MLVSRTVVIQFFFSFFFLAKQCNSFPTLPPLSKFLPKVYRNVSIPHFLGSFFPLLTYSVSIMMLVELEMLSIIKVLLHGRVADKWHSECEKALFLMTCSYTRSSV